MRTPGGGDGYGNSKPSPGELTIHVSPEMVGEVPSRVRMGQKMDRWRKKGRQNPDDRHRIRGGKDSRPSANPEKINRRDIFRNFPSHHRRECDRLTRMLEFQTTEELACALDNGGEYERCPERETPREPKKKNTGIPFFLPLFPILQFLRCPLVANPPPHDTGQEKDRWMTLNWMGKRREGREGGEEEKNFPLLFRDQTPPVQGQRRGTSSCSSSS